MPCCKERSLGSEGLLQGLLNLSFSELQIAATEWDLLNLEIDFLLDARDCLQTLEISLGTEKDLRDIGEKTVVVEVLIGVAEGLYGTGKDLQEIEDLPGLMEGLQNTEEGLLRKEVGLHCKEDPSLEGLLSLEDFVAVNFLYDSAEWLLGMEESLQVKGEGLVDLTQHSFDLTGIVGEMPLLCIARDLLDFVTGGMET